MQMTDLKGSHSTKLCGNLRNVFLTLLGQRDNNFISSILQFSKRLRSRYWRFKNTLAQQHPGCMIFACNLNSRMNLNPRIAARRRAGRFFDSSCVLCVIVENFTSRDVYVYPRLRWGRAIANCGSHVTHTVQR